MHNILSFDVENWFSGKDIFQRFLPKDKKSQLGKSIPPILELLNKHDTRATFFVLGESAEKEPEIIKRICKEGHEIASHGYRHVSLSKLGPKEFEKDIKKSVNLIKKITGKKPIGFRAPMFSLDNNTKWALSILERYGFKYDSSIFPFKSKYYGMDCTPEKPYRISFKDLRKKDPSSGIVEYPIKIEKIFGIPFIITGGFYLRLYPVFFIKNRITKFNKNDQKVIVYLHPWETYNGTPKVKMDFFSEFVTYYNIKKALDKLENLLKSFEFYSFNMDLKEVK